MYISFQVFSQFKFTDLNYFVQPFSAVNGHTADNNK